MRHKVCHACLVLPLKRHFKLGRLEDYKGRLQLVTIEAKLEKGGNGIVLSFVGNVWNLNHSDISNGGQIQDTLEKEYRQGKFHPFDVGLYHRLIQIWGEWHLNNTHGECVHQGEILRKMGILTGRLVSRQYDDLLKIPEMKKCPVCGFEYGSAWNFRPLPADVVAFVAHLPDDWTK